MHFITILIPTILSLAGSASAWAQHSNGVWVANNVMHAIDTCKYNTSHRLYPSFHFRYLYLTNLYYFREIYRASPRSMHQDEYAGILEDRRLRILDERRRGYLQWKYVSLFIGIFILIKVK